MSKYAVSNAVMLTKFVKQMAQSSCQLKRHMVGYGLKLKAYKVGSNPNFLCFLAIEGTRYFAKVFVLLLPTQSLKLSNVPNEFHVTHCTASFMNKNNRSCILTYYINVLLRVVTRFLEAQIYLTNNNILSKTGNHKIVGWRGKMVFDATETMNKNEECTVWMVDLTLFLGDRSLLGHMSHVILWPCVWPLNRKWWTQVLVQIDLSHQWSSCAFDKIFVGAKLKVSFCELCCWTGETNAILISILLCVGDMCKMVCVRCLIIRISYLNLKHVTKGAWPDCCRPSGCCWCT